MTALQDDQANFQAHYQASSPLQKLQLMLTYTGTEAHYRAPDENLPFGQLLLPIGPTQMADLLEEEGPETDENQVPPLFIQIAFADEILKGVAEMAPLGSSSPIPTPTLDKVLLQCSIHFPLQVSSEALPDLARLLGLFTQLSPFGAYGLTGEYQIFYRHTGIYEDKEIVSPLLAWTLEMMITYNVAFYPILCRAATGQGNLDEYGQAALLALAA